MKQILFIAGLIFIVFLTNCSGPKLTTAPIVSNKTVAEKEMAEGNYTQATDAWKLYFSQTSIEQTTGNEFAKAAQSAFKSGDSNQSISWFDQARYKNFSSAEMYSTLAKIFRSQQNISKELSALEYYKSNYSDNLADVNKRLYEIYFEIKMNDKALEVWSELDNDSKNEIANLKSYFKINKSLENTEICDSIASVILEKEPSNVDALEWNGNKFYWLGENRYQREMEKYNKNKTNKQYKILLAELDLATADFKKALPFFEKLWKKEPEEKYASFLANIYARFGDEAKVEYYTKYIK
jgi:tetratricopeptide (TPR) repeat protein